MSFKTRKVADLQPGDRLVIRAANAYEGRPPVLATVVSVVTSTRVRAAINGEVRTYTFKHELARVLA